MNATRYITLSLFTIILNACGEPEEPQDLSNEPALICCEDSFTLTLRDSTEGGGLAFFKGVVKMGEQKTEIECNPKKTSGPGYTCDRNTVTIKGTPTPQIILSLSSIPRPKNFIIETTPRTIAASGPSCNTCLQAEHTLSVVGSCTQIGCDDGIRLFVADDMGQPIMGFTGTASLDGEQFALDCTAPRGNAKYDCGPGSLFIYGDATKPLTLELRAGERTLQEVITTQPYTLEPNGPECDPTCTVAEETVTLR